MKAPKRAKIKRKKLKSIKRLKVEVWELCKAIIRKKYGNICYTCGARNLESSNWHTGHFLPSSTCGALLRYDVRNLRPQCYRCNISLSGNGAVFYRRLVEAEGQLYVDYLFADKQKTVKADRWFYQSLVDNYTVLLNETAIIIS